MLNFPAWGLCEKAAPALLSGVPIVAKPLPHGMAAHRMVEDIVNADILPSGAISLSAAPLAICWTTFEKRTSFLYWLSRHGARIRSI